MTFDVWNKGLNKETDTRLKITEKTKKKISNKLKGKIPKNLSQINANKFNEGNPMWKGEKEEKEIINQK